MSNKNDQITEESSTKLDLCKLELKDQGVWMNVMHPVTGQEIPNARILLLGFDSDEVQKSIRENQNARIKLLGRRSSRTKAAEIMEQERMNVIIAATIGWEMEGVLLDGKPFPPFSKDAARRVYDRFPWLKEQVEEFVNDRANFLPS
jgi:hypothetical protein